MVVIGITEKIILPLTASPEANSFQITIRALTFFHKSEAEICQCPWICRHLLHTIVTCSIIVLQDMTTMIISTLSFSLCQACCEYRTCVHCACDWFCGSSGCGSAGAAGLSVDGMLIRSWSISCRTSSWHSASITQLLQTTPALSNPQIFTIKLVYLSSTAYEFHFTLFLGITLTLISLDWLID